jgi:hypothetical protein
MGFLRDNALRVMRWAESEQLLRCNDEHEQAWGTSFNFTHRWRTRAQIDADAGRVPTPLSRMWMGINSQETVGIAPEFFTEFCAPYYRAVMEPVGLTYWGCCEPVHTFWDDIRAFPHLRKVSISPWCDERFMGEALRGGEVVYSRKPNPNLLGVKPELDEDRWRAEIRETMEATAGTPVEIVIRDVYTVHGDLNKPRRAIQIAREEVHRARG